MFDALLLDQIFKYNEFNYRLKNYEGEFFYICDDAAILHYYKIINYT